MERVARHNSIFAAAACAAVALILIAAPARASITWEWSFESEAGTFVTDGDLVGGLAPAGSYTADPDSLNVTSSAVLSLVGATFFQNQAPSGLLWDGSAPTQFWRADGTLVNGMNFPVVGWSYWYGFNTDEAFLKNHDAGEIVIADGPLTLRPQSAVTTPVPGSIGLVVMGLLSIRRLRNR